MAFPLSPSNNQQATVNGITYSYSTVTSAWTRVSLTAILVNTGSSLVSGTWTFALSTSGSVTLNGVVFSSAGGATAASGTGTTTTFVISNATASTGTNSGALQVVGGVGIGGGLVVGGTVTATNFVGSFSGAITNATTAANVATVQQTANTTYYPTFVDANNVSATGEPVYTTSSFLINPGTGAVTVGTSGTSMGGLTVYKNINNDAINTDGRIIVDFGTVTGESIAGLTVKGGAALSTNLTIGVAQNIIRTGRGSILSGAFIDAEGSRPISFATSSTERLSIEGNGQINVRSTANTTSTTTGALTVAGGVGIGGNVYVGGTVTATNYYVASGSLVFSGNISAPAWTTSGIRHVSIPATLTDTSSTGTVANAYSNNFGGNTIAASNTVTYTNYATMFVNAPVASTNVTITNSYSIITAGGVLVNSTVSSTSTATGALQVRGGVGIGGNLNVGGVITATNIFVNGYAVSTGTSGGGSLSVQYIGTPIGAGTASTLNFGTGTTATLVNGVLTLQVPTPTASAAGQQTTFYWTIDGGGLIPSIGDKTIIQVPFNCYVTQATVVGNTTGSALIYVSTASVASWPSRTLISSSTINLSSSQTLQVNTASWTGTTLGAGTLILASLQSVSGFTFLSLSLTAIKL